jgi:hypothetical protein
MQQEKIFYPIHFLSMHFPGVLAFHKAPPFSNIKTKMRRNFNLARFSMGPRPFFRVSLEQFSLSILTLFLGQGIPTASE